MGLRFAANRVRLRRRYPELARLHDGVVDVSAVLERIEVLRGDHETLRQLVPVHVQFANVIYVGRMLPGVSSEVIEAALTYGYLTGRALLGHDVADRAPDNYEGTEPLVRLVDEINDAELVGSGGWCTVDLAKATYETVVDPAVNLGAFLALFFIAQTFAAADEVLARS